MTWLKQYLSMKIHGYCCTLHQIKGLNNKKLIKFSPKQLVKVSTGRRLTNYLIMQKHLVMTYPVAEHDRDC